MASHVVVIDSTLRRAVVKTEPGTYISDILEQGCKKLGLKAEKYTLKHGKKQVDMTRTFRQSGLSSGAKLELIQVSKSAAPVSVALQLPEPLANGIPNGRLTSTFSSATTFWMILRKFESDEGRNLNITGRGVAQTQQGASGAGRIFYEQPVCQVMGRELSTIPDLQKTLASLGFNSGSCMIRLNLRVTGTPLEEAMAEITEYFKTVEEPQESKAPAATPENTKPTAESKEASEELLIDFGEPEPPTEQDSPMPDINTEASQEASSTKPLSTATATTTTAAPTIPDTILGPGNRQITVFSAPTDSTPRAAARPSNDSDFEPTLAHVALHGSRIKGESRNKRLPTEAEAQKLAEEKAAKKAAIKSVEVKLRFPDQTTTSASFTNEDTAQDLYEFAKGLLRSEISGESFSLSWMAEKGVRVVPKGGTERLILDLGFVGRMLVNFNWEQGVGNGRGPVLKDEYVQKAQDIQIPEVPDVEEDGKGEVQNGMGKGKVLPGGGGENKEKKGMPKWFKGLAKK